MSLSITPRVGIEPTTVALTGRRSTAELPGNIFLWYQFVSECSIDLLRNYFRYEMFRFRARRSKNYEAYTVYMLNNFCKVVAEMWKSQ